MTREQSKSKIRKYKSLIVLDEIFAVLNFVAAFANIRTILTPGTSVPTSTMAATTLNVVVLVLLLVFAHRLEKRIEIEQNRMRNYSKAEL